MKIGKHVWIWIYPMRLNLPGKWKSLPGSNVWGMSFREIHLPRKQRVEHPLAFADPLKSWQSRDNFWVAVEKREVVGYIGVRLELVHQQMRITDLGVAPEFRRKGIATALLKPCR